MKGKEVVDMKKVLEDKQGIYRCNDVRILFVIYIIEIIHLKTKKALHEIYKELVDFGMLVDIYDPWADKGEVKHEYGIDIISEIDPERKYQAIVVCVAHDEFKQFDFFKYKKDNAVIFDAKAFLNRDLVDSRL